MDIRKKAQRTTRSIQKYLIAMIFFSVPLIFSHILYVFGIEYILSTSYSYESIKVTFLLFIIIFIVSLGVIRSGFSSFRFRYDDKMRYLIAIFLIFTISSFLSIDQSTSLFGSPQKSHGMIFYLGLAYLYIALSDILRDKTANAIVFYNRMIIGSGILVSAYAFIQFIGSDPLSHLYSTRVSLDRVFSTFGNANYLAGYMLMLLPLTLNLNIGKYRKISLFAIFGITLILTGSLFGMIISAGYLAYRFLLMRKQKTANMLIISLIVLIVFGTAFYMFQKYNQGNMKLYSGLSRLYLFKSGLNAYLSNPVSILFGNGFDTFYLVFNEFKDPMLNIYEDAKFIADSSHNIFIDILYSIGIIGFSILLYPIINLIKNHKNADVLNSVILFFVFFSFNIPSVSNYLLLIFCLSIISFKQK